MGRKVTMPEAIKAQVDPRWVPGPYKGKYDNKAVRVYGFRLMV